MHKLSTPFLAAAIQYNPKLNRRNANIRELKKYVREAAEKGAKLIVTPEMAQFENPAKKGQFFYHVI